MNCSRPGFPVLHYLPEFDQTHVHWVDDDIQLSHPVLLPSPPAFNLSKHQVFSKEPALDIRWPKHWSFSFSISPPKNIRGWFPLGLTCLISLLYKGLSKCFLQHHSSKASILQCSASFVVQLSHPYMTTGKTIALTIWTFVGKLMSLLLNIVSRFVIAFRRPTTSQTLF